MGTDLVLGGGGFIGGHLVEALAKRGRQVVSVDRKAAGPAGAGRGAHVRLDLFTCSDDDLADLFAGAEVVHHLVWSSFPATAEADPARDLQGQRRLRHPRVPRSLPHPVQGGVPLLRRHGLR